MAGKAYLQVLVKHIGLYLVLGLGLYAGNESILGIGRNVSSYRLQECHRET